MTTLRKVYERLIDILMAGNKSFDLISKSMNKDEDLTRMYVAINRTSRNQEIRQSNADDSLFDIYIHSNVRDQESTGNDKLIDLIEEVKYSLAKPFNYDVHHMGLPGYVFGLMIEDVQFFDDAASNDETVVAIMTVRITHATDVLEREFMPQEY